MKVEQLALVRLRQKYLNVYFGYDDFIFLHRSNDGEDRTEATELFPHRGFDPLSDGTRCSNDLWKLKQQQCFCIFFFHILT